MSTDQKQIANTLQSYRDHLVVSDAAKCAALYTDNGATMAQGFQTQVGKKAIEEWYKLCFSLIALDVEFNIHEIVVASDKYAFARTTSAGTQKVLATGDVSEESNQELFVMEKVGKDWKIARYCFSTQTSPGQ